jgi:DNA-binding NarL/FixJ family response regulator
VIRYNAQKETQADTDGKVRVLVADDHAAVRRGVAQGIRLEPGMDVVGEAGDGASAVRLAKELDPDIVIMDVEMRTLNGIEATHELSIACPRSRVIGLSSYSYRAYVDRMLKAGAWAYVVKDDDFEELIEAIKAVSHGRAYFSSHVEGHERG